MVEKIKTFKVDWRNVLRATENKTKRILLRDEKAKKEGNFPRKVTEVESDWGKLSDLVSVKVRYILTYGDTRILVYNGTNQCFVDLAHLNKILDKSFHPVEDGIIALLHV